MMAGFLIFLLWLIQLSCTNGFTPIQIGKQNPSRYTTTTKLGSAAKSEATTQIRGAVYQAPVLSNNNTNPLALLTQVADSLRVASLHGVDVVVYPEMYLSCVSKQQALDRESHELNIVGNLCGELNVACVMGYVESIGESELKNVDDIGRFQVDFPVL